MEAPGGGRAQDETRTATDSSAPPCAPQVLEFLKRRLAAAILTGDDETAARRIAEPDRLLNGRLAR
jgi:hypothetical protein